MSEHPTSDPRPASPEAPPPALQTLDLASLGVGIEALEGATCAIDDPDCVPSPAPSPTEGEGWAEGELPSAPGR